MRLLKQGRHCGRHVPFWRSDVVSINLRCWYLEAVELLRVAGEESEKGGKVSEALISTR